MKHVSRFGLLTAAVLLTASTVFAGKPERDKIDELTPKAQAVQNTLKSACGCDVHVGVKWDSFDTAGDMAHVDRTLESLESATKTQCAKDADKKALCENVSDVEIQYHKDSSAVTMDGKKIVATTGPNNYSTETMFTDVMKMF